MGIDFYFLGGERTTIQNRKVIYYYEIENLSMTGMAAPGEKKRSENELYVYVYIA